MNARDNEMEPHISSFRAVPNNVEGVLNSVRTMRAKWIRSDFASEEIILSSNEGKMDPE